MSTKTVHKHLNGFGFLFNFMFYRHLGGLIDIPLLELVRYEAERSHPSKTEEEMLLERAVTNFEA